MGMKSLVKSLLYGHEIISEIIILLGEIISEIISIYWVKSLAKSLLCGHEIISEIITLLGWNH